MAGPLELTVQIVRYLNPIASTMTQDVGNAHRAIEDRSAAGKIVVDIAA